MTRSGTSVADDRPTFEFLRVDFMRPKKAGLRRIVSAIVAFGPSLLFAFLDYDVSATLSLFLPMFVIGYAVLEFAENRANSRKMSRFPWMKELEDIVANAAFLRPDTKASYSYEDGAGDGRGITVDFNLDKQHHYDSRTDRIYFSIRFSKSTMSSPLIMSGTIFVDGEGTLVIDKYDRTIGWRAIGAGSFLIDALRQEIAANRADGDNRRTQIDNLMPRATSTLEGSRANLMRLLMGLSTSCTTASRRLSGDTASALGALARHAANVNALIGDNGDPGARISGLLDYILPRANDLVSSLAGAEPSTEVSTTLETLTASFSRIDAMLREEKDSMAKSDALLLGLASSEILSLTHDTARSPA